MRMVAGLITIAVMLCAQSATYAAEQMTKEREGSGKLSGQEMSRQDTRSDTRQSQCQRQGQQGQQAQSAPAGQEQSHQPQGQQSSPGMASGGVTQMLKGQFVRMDGEFYVIKDQSGQEVCIPTSYATFIDQTFVPGDNIVARMSPDGTAAVIGPPSDSQTASAGSQGQAMGTGGKEQSASVNDKGLAGSQQAPQGQNMGTGGSEQSARGGEKGLGGGQQNAQVVKGELSNIQGEFYTVKEQSGNEVRLHVNKETKVEGTLNVGDKIEAERASSGHALSMKKTPGGMGSGGTSRNQ